MKKISIFLLFAISGIFMNSGILNAQTADPVTIRPFSQSVAVGNSVNFQAFSDPYGCGQVSGCVGLEDITSMATWSSDNSEIARSLGDGNFEAVSAGETRINAEYNGKSDSSRVVVIGNNGESTGGGDNYNVSLVKQILDLPGSAAGQQNASAVFVEWFNNHFVVTGHRCKVGSSNSDGLWVFDKQGNLTGERDVCDDSGAPALGFHDWSFGGRIHEGSNDSFVLGEGSTGAFRPPLYYQVLSNGRVNFLGKAGNGSDGGGEGIYKYEDLAAAAGRLVANISPSASEDSTLPKTVTRVFSLPSFEKLVDIPYSVSDRVNPIVGIGNFILGTKRELTGSSTSRPTPPKVFRITSDGLDDTGQTLDDFVANDMSGNRIALGSTGTNLIQIYESGANGLNEVTSWNIPAGSKPPLFESFYHALGLQGSNLALGGVCKPGARVGISGGSDEGDCGFEIWDWQTNKLVAKAKVPGGLVVGIDMSPDGYVAVVTNSSYGSKAYIYKIGNSAGSTGGGSNPSTDGSAGSTSRDDAAIEQERQFLYDATRIYTGDLLKFLSLRRNSNSSLSQSSSVGYSKQCPPKTEEEIKQFQCAYGIVCSGTKETTGYGNTGPITRAKIIEVFPTTARLSCSLSEPASANSTSEQDPQVYGASIDISSLSAIRIVLDELAETAKLMQEKISSLTR